MKTKLVFCSSAIQPNQILSFAEANDRIIFISDNHFYSAQITFIKYFFDNSSFFCLKNFISDSELEKIDFQICQELKNTDKINYYIKYVCLQKKYKTDLLIEKVKKSIDVDLFFYLDTIIGFSTTVFKENNFIEIKSKSFLKTIKQKLTKNSLRIQLMSKIAKTRIEELQIIIYKKNNINYLILAGFKRLHDDNLEVIESLRVLESHLQNEIDLLILKYEVKFLGIEIHLFNNQIAQLRNKIYLIFDGYLPPNYSKSYHEMYPNHFLFSGYLKSQAEFCKLNKLKFEPVFSDLVPNDLLTQELVDQSMQSELDIPPRTIILLLQCSSEWSALINRSDSVLLVNFFIKLAIKNPELNFIIRAHPGMPHPIHDGANSISELMEMIAYLNLKNLSLSKQSLNDDISLGDLFITDYSTTIFDVMNYKKVWISVNLSGRRNFLEYFKQFGFVILNNENESQLFIEKFFSETLRIKRDFQKSIRLYYKNDFIKNVNA